MRGRGECRGPSKSSKHTVLCHGQAWIHRLRAIVAKYPFCGSREHLFMGGAGCGPGCALPSYVEESTHRRHTPSLLGMMQWLSSFGAPSRQLLWTCFDLPLPVTWLFGQVNNSPTLSSMPMVRPNFSPWFQSHHAPCPSRGTQARPLPSVPAPGALYKTEEECSDPLLYIWAASYCGLWPGFSHSLCLCFILLLVPKQRAAQTTYERQKGPVPGLPVPRRL